MGRSLTEAQVLKKLDIVDFRHLTKEKVMSMATMLDKICLLYTSPSPRD